LTGFEPSFALEVAAIGDRSLPLEPIGGVQFSEQQLILPRRARSPCSAFFRSLDAAPRRGFRLGVSCNGATSSDSTLT
jgi:hypothetical protein